MDEIHIPKNFKQLTPKNWTEPDELSSAFAALDLESGEREDISADGWAEHFLSIELSPAVPEEIRDMWAGDRGVLLYGWFFYPLYALGEDQLRRVADAAVLIRYEQVGGPNDPRSGRPPGLKPRLDWLIAHGCTGQRRRCRPRVRRRSCCVPAMKLSTRSRSTGASPVGQQGGCPLRCVIVGRSMPRLP